MRFSLDGVPERDRPAVLREYFGRELIRYDLEPLPDAPLEVDVKFRVLPGLIMMWGRSQGSRNQRTHETLAADPTDDIGMIVNLKGPHHIACDHREIVLGNGEAMLMPLDAAFAATHRPPGDLLALRVPRRQFAPRLTRVEDSYFRLIPAHTPALKMLTDYIRIAQEDEWNACPDLQQLVVNHVQDLMAVAVGASRDGAETARHGGMRAAKLHAIKQDIARSLDQPDLSVATLAARHGCTRRFVQRLFETEGTTFTDHVLEQRLRHAHRVLVDPRRESEKISAVAWDSGFGDVSYFNRAFRRRYGLAPSDVRAQARQSVLA
jgi:AraC-like DNA-binding protein